MRLHIAAIGRLKKGPEQELVSRYADRIKKSGKAVGITALNTVEINESQTATAELRKGEEAKTLLARLSPTTKLIVFDERGKNPNSRAFASHLQRQLESGTQDLAFVVGGPDGLDQQLRDRADEVISFGALTMPHQLVRVMVLEQVYRAVTILTHHPYHRD